MGGGERVLNWEDGGNLVMISLCLEYLQALGAMQK